MFWVNIICKTVMAGSPLVVTLLGWGLSLSLIAFPEDTRPFSREYPPKCVCAFTCILNDKRGQQNRLQASQIVYVSNMTAAVAITSRHAKNSLISTSFTVSNTSHHKEC